MINLFMTKEPKNIQWGIPLQINDVGKLDSHIHKNETGPLT